MFINRVSRQLLSAPELVPLLHELGSGNDASLAVGQSARPLVIAALWARDPRPCLVVVSGLARTLLRATPCAAISRGLRQPPMTP